MNNYVVLVCDRPYQYVANRECSQLDYDNRLEWIRYIHTEGCVNESFGLQENL